MTNIADNNLKPAALGAMRMVVGGVAFSILAVVIESIAIIGASLVTGIVYHLWAYGTAGSLQHYLSVGSITALLYILPFLLRDDYRVHKLLEEPRSVGRVFMVWNYVFLCLGLIGFLTKTTEAVSRGSLVLFYFAGLAVLVGLGVMTRRAMRALLSADRLQRRRVMIVGSNADIARIAVSLGRNEADIRIAAAAPLPFLERNGGVADDAVNTASLADAVRRARALQVDDVVIFTDWSRADDIHAIVQAFQDLPAGIHVGASNIIGPFSDARISRFASMPAVSLTAPPLSMMQMFMKRALDVVASCLALIALAPVFAIVAVLIKTTSPGPVFFRQRRRGYNHREFRIWKFRTMTTMEDGMTIEQARRNDARVTWIGQYLRRTSIDELPQLFNVLAGDMSLVGPRPHAVAHDVLFEKRISAYARRLNVRPGITGLAQINGCRGATVTDEAMRQRVNFDLHYIDNWSLGLDLYIIAKTVLSPGTFHNAH